ncbi:hypothetical protein O181_040646 [Austropuccinia psidii MF-1]|uniref:Uncharacterized protein n=1 Tax=Austropuccinia psidii MF-1 TaxID=1389203 RepID=A0A9Q3DI84_9BASI|nr:hypothetical protein [Austropuccinia psidii MF-1]
MKYCAAGNRLSKRYINRPKSSEEESEDRIEVQIAIRGPLFQTEKEKQSPKEMEATIQSNQIDVDKEEARPSQEVESLPQERHIWRMPELPHTPRSAPKNFDVNSESELIHDIISRDEPF